MRDIKDDDTIRIYISVATLKKIIEAGLFTNDEYFNLITSTPMLSKINIAEANSKAKERQEKNYERTKKQIIHKMEKRKEKAEKRKEKPPKRKRNLEEWYKDES